MNAGNAVLRTVVWWGVFLGWAYLKKRPGSSLADPRSGALGAAGFVLLAVGLGTQLWSAVSLARAIPKSSGVTHDLAAQGPYRYVRNPIYLSGAAVFVGLFLLYAPFHVGDLVAAVLLALALHLFVTRWEEPATQKRLGPPYDEYCRRVPRWIPRLGPPRVKAR